jgi:hypothetical protein
VALRARLTGLQTQSDQQAEQVRRLRAELAAANERLALQGAHFMEQMRRLGAGSLPAAASSPRKMEAVSPARPSLAERVANSRGPTTAEALPAEHKNDAANDAKDNAAASAAKPSGRLADRISNLSKV